MPSVPEVSNSAYNSGPQSPAFGHQGHPASDLFAADNQLHNVQSSSDGHRTPSRPTSRHGASPTHLLPQIYEIAVTVNKLFPHYGHTSGLNEMALRGTGFCDGLQVLFGGRYAIDVVIESVTIITCKVPPSDGPG